MSSYAKVAQILSIPLLPKHTAQCEECVDLGNRVRVSRAGTRVCEREGGESSLVNVKNNRYTDSTSEKYPLASESNAQVIVLFA